MSDERGIESDFVIVGAGPAGFTLGIALRRQGHEVMLLERHDGPTRPVCGEYLSPEGVSALSRAGLFDAIGGFEKIEGLCLVSPAGRRIDSEFPENRWGVSLDRGVFHARLADEFVAAGGQLRYGSTVVAIDRLPCGFRVHARQVEGIHRLRCSALVGADGRISPVARILGMRASQPHRKRVALHALLKPKRELPRQGQMHILAGGTYIGINPVSSSEVNFSMVVDGAALSGAGGARPLINRCIQESPDLSALFGELAGEEMKSTFPLGRLRAQIVDGRVALIGDASGFVDPLAGEGMTTAIKTALILAEEVAKHGDIEAAFQSYAARRVRVFRQKEALNRVFQWLIRIPIACEAVALFLGLSRKWRRIFIGVIGNIYSPVQALKRMALCHFEREI